MTIAFTSIIAIFIIERIDEWKGTISIIPLLLAGIISILYWRQAPYLISFSDNDYFFLSSISIVVTWSPSCYVLKYTFWSMASFPYEMSLAFVCRFIGTQ